MTAELIILILMGGTAVAGAITVVMARNPIYSGVGLLGTMLSLAVIYISQLAHFLAAIQIIVYAGAVMTLFLFVIMLIGLDKSEDRSESLPLQRQIVGVLATVMVAGGIYLGVSGGFKWVPGAPDQIQTGAANGTIEAVAEPLFTEWVLAFEVTALLLTIAAAGAVALALYKRGGVDG